MSLSHFEKHRLRMARFERRLTGDPAAARQYAEAVLDATAHLPHNDAQRGDALEMLCLAMTRSGSDEDLRELLEPAEAVVRIRRSARPAEPELTALALGVLAIGLVANDRYEDADQALRDQLAEYRKAFDAGAIELAQKLESNAEYVQQLFGRRTWAIELLQEAVGIRLQHPESSPGKLAEVIEQLTIYQMQRGEVEQADALLAQAQALLGQEAEAREESRAGLAQILVLRAGVAGKQGRVADAEALAAEARALMFADPALAAENAVSIAGALSIVYELAGDLERATDEVSRAIDVLLDREEDRGLLGDLCVSMAELLTEQSEFEQAAGYLKQAAAILGQTPEVLFAGAELARQSGEDAEALKLYQRALKGRKTATTESAVLFGTNREVEGEAPLRFGSGVAEVISFGRSAVLVPGATLGLSAWKGGRPPDEATDAATLADKLLIREQKGVTEPAFAAAARAQLRRAKLYPNAALVFIHGFNVPFDCAVQRAAQLGRDLNFDGPVFLFSWPSRGRLYRYGTDRKTADASAPVLAEFLGKVHRATAGAAIHVIAHSMGNRVMLQALSMAGEDVRSALGEVVLAAPAVPRAECTRWLDGLCGQGLKRFTLYASKADLAMWAALFVTERRVLAGHVRGRLFTHEGLDSIDISEGGALWEMNHDVFASNPVMVEDMRQLLQHGTRPPDKRLASLAAEAGGWRYEEPLRGS